MKSTPFDPSRHLAPIPFGDRLCNKARELKKAGLAWEPHVGCFVWDPEQTIPAPSPFGGRIYFILNLNRFLQFYSDLEELKRKLVWLPTWHQARLLLKRLITGSPGEKDRTTLQSTDTVQSIDTEKQFLGLYDRLLETLQGGRKPT
jgi:hypothetical protein